MDLDVTLFFQMAILATLMVLLNRALFAPLLQVIEKRHQKIHGLAQEVEQLQRLGAADKEAYTRKMREARQQAGHTREGLRSQGRDQARSQLTEARATVSAAHARTREEVRATEAAAAKILESDVEALSVALLRKLLGGPPGGSPKRSEASSL
jgi:F0F1-type ATP synthase membrane subunit b/b'